MKIDDEIQALNNDIRILRMHLETANFYLERVHQVSKEALANVLLEIVCGQMSIDLRKSVITNLNKERLLNAQ
jgi:hypothetical protein